MNRRKFFAALATAPLAASLKPVTRYRVVSDFQLLDISLVKEPVMFYGARFVSQALPIETKTS